MMHKNYTVTVSLHNICFRIDNWNSLVRLKTGFTNWIFIFLRNINIFTKYKFFLQNIYISSRILIFRSEKFVSTVHL